MHGLRAVLIDAAERWLCERQVATVQRMIQGTIIAVVHFYKRLVHEDMSRIQVSNWSA